MPRGRPAGSGKKSAGGKVTKTKRENNNKFFHQMLKLATAPTSRTDAKTKASLKELAKALVSREEDLKEGKGVVKEKANETEYEVERVLRTRRHGGEMEYLALWKGFRLQESSWEPASNMERSQELIDEYLSNNPTKPGGKEEAGRRGRPSTTSKPKTPKKAGPDIKAPGSGKSTRASSKLDAITPSEEEADDDDVDDDEGQSSAGSASED